MTLHQFLNGIRVFWNIDRDELLACINQTDREFFGDADIWANFAKNPQYAFAQFPTQDQERIFAIIQKRNKDAGL